MPEVQVFELWGVPHLCALGLIVLVSVTLSVIASNASARTLKGVCLCFALILLGNEVIHWAYRLATLDLETFVQRHLPLHVCGITVLAVAATLVFRSQRTYEIAFFWGLVGAANAALTPQLEVGFPEYRFFQYFIVHGGIVAGALFATWGLGMRPSFASLLRAYGWLCALLALLVGGQSPPRQQLHVSSRAAADRLTLFLRALALLHSYPGRGRVWPVLFVACAVRDC